MVFYCGIKHGKIKETGDLKMETEYNCNVSAVCVCGGTMVFDPVRHMLVCQNCRKVRLPQRTGLEPGSVIGGGMYKILKQLGKGGMGTLFLCCPSDDFSRRFVIKTLHCQSHVGDNFVAMKRLEREAELLRALQHPNIVEVYGTWHENDNIFVLMEYIQGQNLEEIKLGGDWEFGEMASLQIMFLIADALEYAWEEYRILHRDIKPSNIMLDEKNHIKLLDFGVAKSLESVETTAVTMAGHGLGTPGYMSPEQFRNQETLDCTTDIYSLGATIYFLLTGVAPVKGNTAMAIFESVLRHTPDPVHVLNPEISENMNRLLQKMLSKNPLDRPRTWQALKTDIQRVMDGNPPL